MQKMEFVHTLKALMIVMFVEFIVGVEHRHFHHEVCTSLVKSHRIKRGEYAEIGHHSRIVMVPAITFRAYVHDETYMEIRLVLKNCLGIFGNLIVQTLGCVPVGEHSSVMLAYSHTLTASHTFGIVNHSFVFAVEMKGIVGTMSDADSTTYAVFAVDLRL